MIRMVVRPAMSLLSGSMIRAAVGASRPVIGSSRTSTGASRRMALAMAIRWRCPPDINRPRCPIGVSYPRGSVVTKSWTSAITAALTTASGSASGLP